MWDRCDSTCFPSIQPLCVFFVGSKFQTKHLFSLQIACNCLPGYSGDGVRQCNPINLCEQVCLHFPITRVKVTALKHFFTQQLAKSKDRVNLFVWSQLSCLLTRIRNLMVSLISISSHNDLQVSQPRGIRMGCPSFGTSSAGRVT